MNRHFRNWLILSATLNILSVGSPGVARGATIGKTEPNLRITVLVYNYAQIPPKTLLRARENASRILRTAGVDVVWADCLMNEAEVSERVCHQIADGPTKLQLTILPRQMAERLPMSSKTFGFSLPAGKDGFGANAYVFANRVEELVEQLEARVASLLFSPDVILSHVMTHEIGHLLLGTNSHSTDGIMLANWGRKYAKLVSRGELLFTRAQGKRMRAQVLNRIRTGRERSSLAPDVASR